MRPPCLLAKGCALLLTLCPTMQASLGREAGALCKPSDP